MSKFDGEKILNPLQSMEKRGNAIFFGSGLTEEQRSKVRKGGNPNRPFVNLDKAYANHRDVVRQRVESQIELLFDDQ